MKTENDLIQKLMVSKKIMDRHSQMPRGQVQENISLPSSPQIQDFSPISSNYNLPAEYLSESPTPKVNQNIPTKDRIINSKLPDDIKRLMLEHPINQPQTNTPSLSNELVEAASRLMRKENGSSNSNQTKNLSSTNTTFNMNDIRQVVRETMEEVLRENGLLIEEVNKTNESMRFQVGEHIFEGKIVKIKKTKR